MYLWEFNNYVIGYNDKLLRDQEYIVSVAYQAAAFNNSKHKPKPLKHYIDKLRSSVKHTKNKDVVDVEKAKDIERKIEELKKKKGGG